MSLFNASASNNHSLTNTQKPIFADPGWYNDPQKRWEGTAASRDTIMVSVQINGQPPLFVPVINGRFSWTPSQPLADGEYVITFLSIDRAGNGSNPVTVNYNIDTVPPSKPQIIAIEDNVVGGVQDGDSIEKNGYTNDANPVMRGLAEANSVIYIYDENSVTPLASVRVNSLGEWEVEVLLPGDGVYELSAVAVDRADNRSEASQKWSFILDTQTPEEAAISFYLDDVGLYRGQFNFSRATDDRRPEIHGVGDSDEYVEVQYANSYGVWISAGTVTVDSNGNWKWAPPDELSDGEWHFRVKSIDHAGNMGQWSNPTFLQIDTTTIQPTIDLVIDDVGPVSIVEPGTTTDDARLDFAGKAEVGSLVTLYQNGIAVGSGEANVYGYWKITPSYDMNIGINTFNVKAIDAAGNESTYSLDYPVNFKPIPQYERNSENWESRVNDNWVTGQTYAYGKLKVTELYHGTAVNGWHTGIMTNIKTYTGYYQGRAVSMLDNSIVKYDFGETDYISFNYANLHNYGTLVKIFSPTGELISVQTLAYSGTINNESQSANFSYQASKYQPIGYIEVHSSFDPDFYNYYWYGKTQFIDVGWSIDTMTWRSGNLNKINGIVSTDSSVNYSPVTGEMHIVDVDQWLITSQLSHPELVGSVIFDGANQIIDFAAISEQIEGMHKIDLTGKGNNQLKLDLKALLTEGGNGLFISENSKQFMIDGNVGDRITLDRAEFSDGWLMSQNKVQVGGENWTLLTNSKEHYTLVVNQEIDITYG